MSKQRDEELLNEKKLTKIMRSRHFVTPQLNPKIDHARFFIFRWPGDEVEGILGPPIRNYRRNTSYPLEQKDGRTIEFFGNKLLHNIIDENKLIGSYVRIVYVGDRLIPGMNRRQKVYAVYKIKGIFIDQDERQHPKPKK